MPKGFFRVVFSLAEQVLLWQNVVSSVAGRGVIPPAQVYLFGRSCVLKVVFLPIWQGEVP